MHPGSCGPRSECAGAAVEVGGGWDGEERTQEQSPTGIVVFHELHTLRASGNQTLQLEDLFQKVKVPCRNGCGTGRLGLGTVWVVFGSAVDPRWIEIAPKWREWGEGQTP